MFFISTFFLLGLISIFCIKYVTSKSIINKIDYNEFQFNHKTIFNLEDIKCETFTSGLKNTKYLFSRCNLIILDDAIIVYGFNKIFNIKLYKSVIIVTNNVQFYKDNTYEQKIFPPKKINLNSFHQDVFIEIGESSFTTTSIDLRLKNLTAEQKSFIKL